MRGKLPPEVLDKRDAFTFLSTLCLRCSRNFDCVSGSRIALSPSAYVLSISKQRSQPKSQAMLEGLQKHEEYAHDIPEISELGPSEYYRRLLAGEEVKLSESKVCTMARAMRGSIDVLTMQRFIGKNGPEYNITIQDNKLSFAKETFRKGMFQLAHYGMIFGNPTMAFFHVDPENNLWIPVFPDPDPILNIRCFLHDFKTGRDYPDSSIRFMTLNKISEWWMKYVINVYKLLKQKRELNRRGLYMLDLMEECPDCKGTGKTNAVPPKRCDTCKGIGKLTPHERQLFFGKNKVLVKTAPRDYARSNFRR